MAGKALLQQIHHDTQLLIQERDALRTDLQHAHSAIQDLLSQNIELEHLCAVAQKKLLNRLPEITEPKTAAPTPETARTSSPKPLAPSPKAPRTSRLPRPASYASSDLKRSPSPSSPSLHASRIPIPERHSPSRSPLPSPRIPTPTFRAPGRAHATLR
ncbi:hypothetical protein MMC16_005247 [Acarospora aff. strigata]|nr:hypothetical protein [Acarospora aff. strigata]